MALVRVGGGAKSLGVAAVLGCAAAAWALISAMPPRVAAMPTVQAAAHLPVAFEPAQAQPHAAVDFLARGLGYTLLLTATQAELRPVDGPAVTMQFIGAASPLPQAEQALPGRRHYLLGADPRHWRTEVPTYGAVRYRGIYPGVDLVYYGRQGELEYDFVVAPGADPQRVRLAYRGAVPTLAADGSLVLNTGAGAVVQHPPRAYQTVRGRVRPVGARYVVDHAGRVGVRLAAYDTRLPVVIDPVLSFSSYLGGLGTDRAWAIRVDDTGAVYIAGETASPDLGAGGTVNNAAAGGADAFVAKFTASGSVEFVTYLGGLGADRAYGVAVDAAHNVYLAGETDSSDFPTQSPLLGVTGGGTDAFVAKLSASGATLSYATRLGGAAADSARGLAVDGAGAAYVVGATASTDFPFTAGAFQTAYQGGDADGFVAMLEFDGTTLSRTYATYAGSAGLDNVAAIAVDGAGNAYLAGLVSADVTSFARSNHGGNGDAFVAKLNPAGTGLTYGVYIGGTLFERATAIAIDGLGNAYVTGLTNSAADFPITANAYQRTYGGGQFDAFMVRATFDGSVDYVSYVGGQDIDQAYGIAADGAGQAYIVGETRAVPVDPFNPGAVTPTNTFPLAQAVQGARDGSSDGFVSVLSAGGGAPGFSTYFGGSGADVATAAALGPGGILHVAGYSASTDLPLAGAAQIVNKGGDEAFVAQFSWPGASADLALSVTSIPDTVRLKSPYVHRIQVANVAGPDAATAVVVRDTLPSGLLYQSSPGDCSAADNVVTCRLGDIAVGQSASVDITVVPTSGGPLVATAQVLRAHQSDPVASNNSAAVSTTITVGDSGGGAWGLGLLLPVWAWAWRRRRVSGK